jgi:hypothetical protein
VTCLAWTAAGQARREEVKRKKAEAGSKNRVNGMSDIEHVVSKGMERTGMSDMAGEAARVAVEPSGSEQDTMELLGKAT